MLRALGLGNSERYQVVRVIGSGATGTVFEVDDVVRGQRVALKILRSLEQRALAAFKLEFHAIADVRHRHLVELYNLECVDDSWKPWPPR